MNEIENEEERERENRDADLAVANDGDSGSELAEITMSDGCKSRRLRFWYLRQDAFTFC
jgi:hypothetical protein